RAFLDADHSAEHDHPDEEKPRQLLGPDVARDQLRIARDDLERDWNDQERDGRNHQPSEELAIAVDQLFHARKVTFEPDVSTDIVVPAQAGTHIPEAGGIGPRLPGDANNTAG